MGCGSSLNTELNNVARNTDDTARARALVAQGADLASTNGPHWRHTPLHQAAYHGRLEMAKTLVELRAPLHMHSNPCGRGGAGTPLELARGGGHMKIAEMLEQAMKSAPAGSQEKSASTPSHGNPPSTSALNTELNNVARNTDDTAKARALVAQGADLASTNGPHWRHTPLHQAAYHGRFEMAKTLVELRAPLHMHSNPCGRGAAGTPLELARGGGHMKIAEMLEQAMKNGPAAAGPSRPVSDAHSVLAVSMKEADVVSATSGVRLYTTKMLGGHTGVNHGRAGSAKPRLVEFPSFQELQGMSRMELENLRFTRIGWKARGALDALQFTRADGVTSPFYGACPSLNGSAAHFGDVRGQMNHADLKGDIRAVEVFWYQHDVTGLAFIGKDGRVIAQEGPGSCRDGFGKKRLTLESTEKLVGFRLYTDHSTPQIAFHIADLGKETNPVVVMATIVDEGPGADSNRPGPKKSKPLVEIVAILKRELGLEGNMTEVVNAAAKELGVEKGSHPLTKLAEMCLDKLGCDS